jgi:5,10-methylene-tetrahydrofolate dehydrogenase/methenyl tetrahydrofolate cyclohydrolase
VKTADVLVCAIGKPLYVQGDWIKPGAVVVDVGTNYIPGTPASLSLLQQTHVSHAQMTPRNLASVSSVTSTLHLPRTSRRTSRPSRAVLDP